MMKATTPRLFFKIDRWRQWTVDFFPWLEESFCPDVLADFHEDVGPTWIEWLDQRQAVVEGDRVDGVARCAKALTHAYAGIRVFHATRQRSLDDMARRGLRAWTADELILQERERFRGRVDTARLDEAIRRANPEHRASRVYTFSSLGAALGIAGDNAPGRLPHFARHGGEFHQAVSTFLGVADQDDGSQAARAYLLACDVPWDALCARSIDALATDVLQSVLTRRYLDTAHYNMFGQCQTVATERDIPPTSIVRVADVQAFVDRAIRPEDIEWISFPLGS